MTWRIRWYLVIAITIAYALSLIGGLIGFWITRNICFLSFIAPSALIPFVRYLVPMDKKRYDLELAKKQYDLEIARINADKELSEARTRIQMLEAEVSKQRGQLPTK